MTSLPNLWSSAFLPSAENPGMGPVTKPLLSFNICISLQAPNLWLQFLPYFLQWACRDHSLGLKAALPAGSAVPSFTKSPY